ncbi:MAG: hypothetical protein E2598_12185 [Sphingobium sp.]|nr:hypothetical protein [Sphingobium sp.]
MRWLVLSVTSAVLASSVLSVAQARSKGPARFFPDPSSIFAADIAFSRMAREQGQWTAFRKTAADDAVIAVQRPELAANWLKGKQDPPQAVKWQAHRAYVSCDGRLGATTGAWQGPDGAQGYFTTVWRRDKKGEWKWVFDHWDRLMTPRDSVEALEGHVANCKNLPGRRGPGADIMPSPDDRKSSKDHKAEAPPLDESLRWSYDIGTDGSRHVRISLWNGSGYDMVIEDKVGAVR